MANEWFYSKNGKRFGPVSGQQLKELAANGQLAPADLVWKEGMKEWLPASKIKGLLPNSSAVTSKPTSPVTPPASTTPKQPAKLAVTHPDGSSSPKNAVGLTTRTKVLVVGSVAVVGLCLVGVVLAVSGWMFFGKKAGPLPQAIAEGDAKKKLPTDNKADPIIGGKDKKAANLVDQPGIKDVKPAPKGPAFVRADDQRTTVHDATRKLTPLGRLYIDNFMLRSRPVFSPDGSLIAMGGIFKGQGAVWVIRSSTAETFSLLPQLDSTYLTSVCFTPDSKRLLVGGKDRTVKLINANSSTVLSTFPFVQEVAHLSITPDEKSVFVGGGHRYSSAGSSYSHRESGPLTMRTVDLTTGASAAALNGKVLVEHMTPLGKSMNLVTVSMPASGVSPGGLSKFSDRFQIAFWNLKTNEKTGTIDALPSKVGRVTSLASSADGSLIAVAIMAETTTEVHVLDVATKKPSFVITEKVRSGPRNDQAFLAVAFSPAHNLLAVGNRYGMVSLYDYSTQKQVAMLSGHKWEVQALAFSPSGDTLISATPEGYHIEIGAWRIE